MRRIVLILLLVAPVFCAAQQRVVSTRLEVTGRLDARPHEEALRVVAPYKTSVDSVMCPVLGTSLVQMSAGRPESLLGNWAADALVASGTSVFGCCPDLGIVNVGGLRNVMPKGTVRKGDIILISPFENRLCLVSLTGTDLLSLMNDIAAVGGEGVSREVCMQITSDGQLSEVKINGKAIEPDVTYRIATLDYLAEGNDKLYSFKKAVEVTRSDVLVRDCMMQCVELEGTITSEREGRIVITDK